MSKNKIRDTKFWEYFQPLIDALIDLGGSGRPSEVKELIAIKLNISEEEQSEQISSGQSRYGNKVDWARLYLAKVGYIDSSARGVWTITENGRYTKLTNEDAVQIVQKIRKQTTEERKKHSETTDITGEGKKGDTSEIPDDDNSHRTILLHKLLDLPADGFERLCQRLLREIWF